MQYLFLPLQFIGKAVSAALFGILLLIAFALTAPMGSHEFTHICTDYSDMSLIFKT